MRMGVCLYTKNTNTSGTGVRVRMYYLCMHVCAYVTMLVCIYGCVYVCMQCMYVCIYDNQLAPDLQTCNPKTSRSLRQQAPGTSTKQKCAAGWSFG